MMAKFLCIISCFIIAAVNLESFADYDADRKRDINDPQPFRLNKLNMMWEKAKKVNVISHPVFRHMACQSLSSSVACP